MPWAAIAIPIIIAAVQMAKSSSDQASARGASSMNAMMGKKVGGGKQPIPVDTNPYGEGKTSLGGYPLMGKEARGAPLSQTLGEPGQANQQTDWDELIKKYFAEQQQGGYGGYGG